MMNPNQARVIDPILTTVVQGYKNADFVGHALFPRVPVAVSGGKIIEFGKEHFLAYNTQRAPGGATKRISFGYQGKPYAVENHALEAPVPREYMRDAAKVPGINLGTRAVNLVMRSEGLALEIQQAQLATDASQYGANNKLTLSGTDKFSDSTSDIEGTFDDAKEAVRTACGMYPNVALFGPKAFRATKRHAKVKEQFKYVSDKSVTTEMLGEFLEIEKVVVGKAVQASDAGAMSDVWGNCIVLAYVPPAPSQAEEPSYGYTYTLEGHPMVEAPYWDSTHKSWIYGVTDERVPVLSGIASGFLIINPY
ncbi:MAG: major capsid protein [Desulfovibrio sp.]